MTNSPIIITNPDRRMMALITLKHRLRIEIETGLSHSGRVSLIGAAKRWGYEGPKSKKKCLAWVLEQLGE